MKQKKHFSLIRAGILLLVFLYLVFPFSLLDRSTQTEAQESYQTISFMDQQWIDLLSEGNIRYDYQDYLTGSASLRIEADERGYFTGAYYKIPYQDLASKGFKITFKTSSWERLESFLIGFSSNEPLDKIFSNFHYIDLKYYLASINDGEWQSITLSPSNLPKSGEADWRNIGNIFIRISSSQHPSPVLWLDEISMFNNRARKGVVIAFDDGHISAYTKGKIIMDRYGYPGAQFIIPSFVGEPGFVNLLQIFDMAASGWDIGGHSDYLLPSIPDDLLESDIRETQAFLSKYNLRGRHFYALPYGRYDDRVLRALKPYFPFVRPNYSLHQPSGYVLHDTLNSQVVSKYTPVEEVFDWIDLAEKNNDLLILVFHKIETKPIYDSEYGLDDFIRVLEYLKHSKMPVTTLSDYFNLP